MWFVFFARSVLDRVSAHDSFIWKSRQHLFFVLRNATPFVAGEWETHLLHTRMLLRPKITPPLHPSTQQPLPKRLLPPMIRSFPPHGEWRHLFPLILLFSSFFPLLLTRKLLKRFVELWDDVVCLLGLHNGCGARWIGGGVVREALFPVGLER